MRRRCTIPLITLMLLLLGLAAPSCVTRADQTEGTPPAEPDKPGERKVMGGLETRLAEAGDDTPLVGDKPGDVERLPIGFPAGVPLALPDGRVMLWETVRDQGRQHAAARYSTDCGGTWSELRELFEFPAKRGTFSSGAALYSQQGSIHLFGLDYYDFNFSDRKQSKSLLWHGRSRDGGKTWDPVNFVDFGWQYTGASNNAFQLKSGRIFAPCSGLSERRVGPWVSLTPYSDDNGATWHAPKQQITMNTGAVDWYESGAAEPIGIELKDGSIWLLPRSQDGYQWESFSRDGGTTWTPVRHTRFVSNQSAMALIRLADERLILFWCNCGPEGVEGIYAERLVMAAAISSDEGRTWHGYREIGRRTTPGEISYPYITQMKDGHVLLSAAGNLWRVHPDFLLKKSLREDFADGIRRWSTLATKGVCAAPHPDGGEAGVLSLLKPDPAKPAAACMNFPYAVKGEIAIQLRIEPGFQGAHFTLADHYDLPGLPRDGAFPYRITPRGRVRIPTAGGAWVDTPGDLTPGKWAELRLRWDCEKGNAHLTLDGAEIAQLEQFIRTPGVCYLRLRSEAPTTDTAGLYVRSVVMEGLD